MACSTALRRQPPGPVVWVPCGPDLVSLSSALSGTVACSWAPLTPLQESTHTRVTRELWAPCPLSPQPRPPLLLERAPLTPLTPSAAAVSTFAAAQTAITFGAGATYPFDTIRRRLQIQSEKPAEEHIYKGTMDCFKKIA